MITIHPKQNDITVCPNCSSKKNTTNKILFPGLHVVADCSCEACGYNYIQDLPVGHAVFYPVSIGLDDQKVYDSYSIEWFTTVFATSYFNQNKVGVKVDRIVRKTCQEIILVNCLDYLYGHVLLKLFNVEFYKKQHPDKGIVVIVPSNYVWLVPDYVDEIWVVDIKLSQLRYWYSELSVTLDTWLLDYKEVLLGDTYPHPCTEEVTIEDFTKVTSFDLRKFELEAPVFTYIYRTDRLWVRFKLEYLLFLVLRKLNLLKIFSFLFPGIQHLRIKHLANYIKQHIPSATFQVVGIGNKGDLGVDIKDYRVSKPDSTTEKKWAELYAASHVVIGIHGSNMLLPTSLAASFVELLPFDRVGNLTQDVITKHSGRQALYLNRFIPEQFSAKQVANQVIAIYKGWPMFNVYNNPKNQNY